MKSEIKKVNCNFQAPVVDYRKLSWKKLNSAEYRHLKLLMFWPVFGLLFQYVERFYPVEEYYAVFHPLDNKIPFFEYFLIPYLFWFLYLVGMHIYTLFYDIGAFRKMMNFIMLTYLVTILIYFLFPTCQELRPSAFERDNIFTRIMADYYQFDTNTNVCPSLHVIGSLAVMFASFHCKDFKTLGWKLFFITTAVLISISTVFLKQHSVLDIVVALPICIIAYFICFCKKEKV